MTLVLVISALLLLTAMGCGNEGSESGDHQNDNSDTNKPTAGSESGEHDSNGGESEEGSHGPDNGEGDEESGVQFAPDETFDQVRAGARLVLSYDPIANAFNGTVQNTTGITLDRVRVEVHLSNGIELGPTTPLDLAPGQSVDITLQAPSQPFSTWNAHPEVG